MKLEWIDDLLAVIESGSFNAAAKRRHLTQPAFSRRIRAIENEIGAELFDRSSKPVALRDSVLDQEKALRDVSRSVRNLVHGLRGDSTTAPSLVIAAQHAISSALAPGFLRDITDSLEQRIRLHSANRDACFSMLLTGKAGIALIYQLSDEKPENLEKFVDVLPLGKDRLVPVIATTALKQTQLNLRQQHLDIIAYPRDEYFGQVLYRHILPALDSGTVVHSVVETALTTAALQFSLSGTGVSWIPESLIGAAVAASTCTRLDRLLPVINLRLVAMRLPAPADKNTDVAWQNLSLAKSVDAEHNTI